LAASAERWAKPRTSLATTAKPRPMSPARAASTPAFSANRLVWKAISSITPMIASILREEAWIRPMAVTAQPRSPWASRLSAADITSTTSPWRAVPVQRLAQQAQVAVQAVLGAREGLVPRQFLRHRRDLAADPAQRGKLGLQQRGHGPQPTRPPARPQPNSSLGAAWPRPMRRAGARIARATTGSPVAALAQGKGKAGHRHEPVAMSVNLTRHGFFRVT
jgi:hypothetical protein